VGFANVLLARSRFLYAISGTTMDYTAAVTFAARIDYFVEADMI
jgi:hypothetical protein